MGHLASQVQSCMQPNIREACSTGEKLEVEF